MDRPCDRCKTSPETWTMSMLNLDWLCARCDEDEQRLSTYPAALAAEAAAIAAGDVHYAGIGLSPEDEAFLAELRAARKERP
jgi:methylphosphotriester-DNA--protein-cysteine methyltransferase